jgi:RNA polymerase primary sigma factor
MSYFYGQNVKHPAEYFSKEIEKNPILKPEEEVKLFKSLSSNKEETRLKARDSLIKTNLKLIIKIASKYKNLGMPVEDLISEGCLGLVRAIEKYDPKKKTKFSFYAALWIRQAVTRALSNKSKTIRIPHGLINEAIKVNKIKTALEEELGRVPTYEELAKKSDLTVKKIKKIFFNIPTTISLSTPSPEEEECNLEMVIPDTKECGVVEHITKEENSKILKKLLSELTDREYYVLVHRFGLDNKKKKTLDTIGKKFDLTRERIRQIERESLFKLKKRFDKISGERLQWSR